MAFLIIFENENLNLPPKKSWVPLYRLNAWKSSDLFWRSFHISNFWSLTLLPTHFWPCNSPLWSRARGKPGGVWLEKLRRFSLHFRFKNLDLKPKTKLPPRLIKFIQEVQADQTLPFPSRESCIWIILRTILCLVDWTSRVS